MPKPKGADAAAPQPRLLIVLKGYPRISETFIAQELLGLQRAGLAFQIISLRPPYDAITHPIHDQITAPVLYLPEYLHKEPLRVLSALAKLSLTRGFWALLPTFLRDFARDPARDRVRRLGQALVLVAELRGDGAWIYSHFAHTPTSVARYAARMAGARFSISAHAKDIWTSPDWDLRAKLTEAQWTVTCTDVGRDRLTAIAPDAAVHLLYHGLDLARFPTFADRNVHRDGSDPGDPVRILSVGRAVPKKGYDTLLEALAKLPEHLNWTFEHIGRGPELAQLQRQAQDLGLADAITWRGVQDQAAVLEAYRRSDVFVLASHSAQDGDRDGLPNVLVEAASQGMACVATAFSAIPELIEDQTSGLLVPTGDSEALAAALGQAIADPALRTRLGRAAEQRVRAEFDLEPGIARLTSLFRQAWAQA